MKIVNSIEKLKTGLAQEKREGRSIGFVPTMGALHDGHLSLVKQCIEGNDVCVVSIFVNPTQFNDKNDLATYPRTLESDCALLEKAGCDYVFTPPEAEMYPVPDTRRFDFGTLSEVMEGAYRPGHFNGVAQIVSKLFDAVEPDRAYFGEKDFQQIAVVRAMTKQLELAVQIVACPILREEDGLAMSSRNVRLTPGQRQKAPLIARTLKESTNFVPGKSVKEIVGHVVHTINNEPQMRVEYFEIVDGNTLEPIENWADTTYPVGCIVVYCGDVRLIDNIKY
ncbi:MAG: pantoate--beta-alanine ligase [Tannerellaceae bacterium]|jgi:pantoate--beta-alanine ligase|nr:pantoate--beta-alanine ligase [Tannerellaceae bacterium]